MYEKENEELKNLNFREFLTTSINLLRDANRTDAALHLLDEIRKMDDENKTIDFKRNHIIKVLMNVFLNKTR